MQSCCDAFDRVGFPEGLFFLAQASLYLAISPKSNSIKSIFKAVEAINHLIKFSGGDARNLINALELAISITKENKENLVVIDLPIAEDSIQKKNIVYDKNGQNHFDVISAFIKSIRGSDPDATLYWLANMVEAGEDPNFIF